MSTSGSGSYTNVTPVLKAIGALQDKIRAIEPVSAFDKNRRKRILAVLQATSDLLHAECTGTYLGLSDYYCFQFNSAGEHPEG